MGIVFNGDANDQNYILGVSFLRNFYSVFNYKENSIGLGVAWEAPSGAAISPTLQDIYPLNNGEWVSIYFVGVLFVFVVIYVIWHCIKEAQANKKEQAKQEFGSISPSEELDAHSDEEESQNDISKPLTSSD